MTNNLIKKIDTATTNIEKDVVVTKRKIRRAVGSRKAKVIAGLIVIVLLFIAINAGFYFISKWYRTHDVIFRSPVIIRSWFVITDKKPVIIEKVKVIVTPMPTPDLKTEKTEKELILAQKHGDSLWKIYQLETQRGKTDNCRATGEGFAGFGVMFDDKVVCYPTFEKAVERAEYWFNSFKPEVSLVNALCTWNLGHNVDPVSLKVVDHNNCSYYQKFLTVNN